MPPKPGKKDSKMKNKKDADKRPAVPNPADLVRHLMRQYKANCELTESSICKRLVRMMESCIENETQLVQFHIESNHDEVADDLPVKLEPLLKALRSQRYTFIKDLYIWTYPMCFETLATLSTFISLPVYVIRKLELRDCLLTPHLMQRFCVSLLSLKCLVHLNLDFNEFGCDGCWHLCQNLQENKSLLSLSLCYCNLGNSSGIYLNTMISRTCVKELYLDGNHIDCEGAVAIIESAIEMAVTEETARAEERKRLKEEEQQHKKSKQSVDTLGSRGNMQSPARSRTPSSKTPEPPVNKPKKKKGKKGAKGPVEPVFGPYIQILSLADNEIDNMTHENEQLVALCMKSVALLIANSQFLMEIDLGENQIGNVAALPLIDGLKTREANGLPPIKMRTTHRLDGSIYTQIKQLAAGAKKKGKGKRKKK